MTKAQDSWITKRLDLAHRQQPVEEQVVLEIKVQLRETMSERALKPGELNTLANTLLGFMSNPLNPESKK